MKEPTFDDNERLIDGSVIPAYLQKNSFNIRR